MHRKRALCTTERYEPRLPRFHLERSLRCGTSNDVHGRYSHASKHANKTKHENKQKEEF